MMIVGVALFMLVFGLCLAVGYRKCRKDSRRDKYAENGRDNLNNSIMNTGNELNDGRNSDIKYGKNGTTVGVPVNRGDSIFDEDEQDQGEYPSPDGKGTKGRHIGGGCGCGHSHNPQD